MLACQSMVSNITKMPGRSGTNAHLCMITDAGAPNTLNIEQFSGPTLFPTTSIPRLHNLSVVDMTSWSKTCDIVKLSAGEHNAIMVHSDMTITGR